MVNLNHILAGSSTQIQPGSAPVVQPPESPAPNREQSSPLSPDRFTLGQPWKNKVSATGGNSKWGVQAYAEQQRVADDSAIKKEVAGGEGATKREVVAATGEKGPTGELLAPEEVAQLQELQKIDQKVRAHEQAHMGAAGGLATSGISLSYVKGPDGQNYAVGGEVSIDSSAASTPRETISKMMKVRAAALAPSDPSAQDRKVAASASVVMGEARAELQIEQQVDGEQVVEQAVANLVGETGQGAGEEQDAVVRPQVGGGYQRTQYEKVAGEGAATM